MKSQAGAMDILVFIILVMTASILLLQTSGNFLKPVSDNLDSQNINLKLKQIFVTMISLKNSKKMNDPYNGFSYIYLKKEVCSGKKTISDFFNYVRSEYNVNLVDYIDQSIGKATVLIIICDQCIAIDGSTYSCGNNIKDTINILKDKSNKVVVYGANVFGKDDDFKLYYFR